ncbi:hypothetical protein OB959_16970 [Aeromonas bestiarum]|uniref:Uncharacterized protein n=1 Tax=Aeromonas bestiarum TaxID=105751 RepID=A0AAW7HZY2_9GAMM|nr:hypothetical protein [Aeromonas bestiarum]MDM5141466.1 hypothetical protein [Aeromonas bestiarum]
MKKNLAGFILCTALPFASLASETDYIDMGDVRASSYVTNIEVKMGESDHKTDVKIWTSSGNTYSCQELGTIPSKRVSSFLELSKLSMVLKYSVYGSGNNCNLKISN